MKNPIRVTGEAMPRISRRALLTSATALAVIPTAALASSTAPVASSLPDLVARLHAAIAANVEADAAYDAALSAFERAYRLHPIRYTTSAGVLALELPHREKDQQRHIRLDGEDVAVPQAVWEADGNRRRAAAAACSWTDDELRSPELIAARRAAHVDAKAASLDQLRGDVAALEAARAEYSARHRAAVGAAHDASDARIAAEWDLRAAFYALPCTTDGERRLKVETLMRLDGDKLDELATGPDDQRDSSLAVFVRSLCGAKVEA